MRKEQSQITAIKLTDMEGLDAIKITLEDFDKAQGEITIICYGKAWTSYWGGMGDRTIAEFFCSCDEHYLAKNLSQIDSEVTDFDALSQKLGFEVNQDNLIMIADQLAEHYGDEWFRDLPQERNPDYTYLCRIIKAVQEGLS